MKTFEFRNTVLLHLLSGLVLFGWVGLLAVFIREAYGPVPVILYYGVAVFSFIGIHYITLAFDKRIQVRIDEVGIVDRRNGLGYIPWDEIKELKLMRRRAQWLMTLKVAHPEEVAQKAPASSRLLHKLFGGGFSLVKIPLEDSHVNDDLRGFIYSMAGASDMPVKLGQ